MAIDDLSVRTGLSGKLRALAAVVRRDGVGGVWRTVAGYLRYQVVAKRRFLFFVGTVERSPLLTMKRPSVVTIFAASRADRTRIERDLFPHLVGNLEYERRYFDRLGVPGLVCLVAESGGRLVHYSWVFDDASRSILRDVRFDRRLLQPGDSFIGPVFTAPDARGFIYVSVLAEAMRYVQSIGGRRLWLFVDAGNVSAPAFYQRLGFLRSNAKLSDRIANG